MNVATAVLIWRPPLRRVGPRIGWRKDARNGRKRGSRPSAGQSCRTVAAPLQGSASRSTAESSGQRSPVPQPSAGAAADFEGTAAAFQQPAATAAKAHPATHGDLGTPDARIRSSRLGSCFHNSEICRLTAGKRCGPRSATSASCLPSSGNRSSIPTASKTSSRPRNGDCSAALRNCLWPLPKLRPTNPRLKTSAQRTI